MAGPTQAPVVVVVAWLLAAGCAVAPSPLEPVVAVSPPGRSDDTVVAGIVRHRSTDQPIANAEVELSCACLDAPLRTVTNEYGRYRFESPGPGAFELRVVAGRSDSTRQFELPEHARLRANFRLEPPPISIEQKRLPVPAPKRRRNRMRGRW